MTEQSLKVAESSLGGEALLGFCRDRDGLCVTGELVPDSEAGVANELITTTVTIIDRRRYWTIAFGLSLCKRDFSDQ